MTSDERSESAEPPNLVPGPADRGGHGGMATREAEAREQHIDPQPLSDPPQDEQ